MLPFGELGSKVVIAGICDELIELLLVCSVRPLDLAIELRRCEFDIGVPDALVLDMPMEFCLEFMAIVRSNLADAEREPGDDGIDEVNRV